MSPQRQSRIYALKEHAKGHIAKYKAELDILLDNPIGYQGDILGVMMDNLEQIARYEEHLTVLDKHFDQGSKQ